MIGFILIFYLLASIQSSIAVLNKVKPIFSDHAEVLDAGKEPDPGSVKYFTDGVDSTYFKFEDTVANNYWEGQGEDQSAIYSTDGIITEDSIIKTSDYDNSVKMAYGAGNLLKENDDAVRSLAETAKNMKSSVEEIRPISLGTEDIALIKTDFENTDSTSTGTEFTGPINSGTNDPEPVSTGTDDTKSMRPDGEVTEPINSGTNDPEHVSNGTDDTKSMKPDGKVTEPIISGTNDPETVGSGTDDTNSINPGAKDTENVDSDGENEGSNMPVNTATPYDIGTDDSTLGGINVNNYGSSGLSADVSLALDVNTTFFINFVQTGNSVSYDVSLDIEGSEGGCVSWMVGLPQNVGGGTDKCKFALDSPPCLNSISSNVCEIGLSGFGACGNNRGVAGKRLGKYGYKTSVKVDHGSSSAFSLDYNNSRSIIGYSIMVIFTPFKDAPQRIACTNVEITSHAAGNDQSSSASSLNSYEKLMENGLLLGSTVLSASALYYTGL